MSMFQSATDWFSGQRLFVCDDCDHEMVEDKMVFLCEECGGEARIAPASRQVDLVQSGK